MTDEKKIKDEELANITGAGDAPGDLGDQKKPTGGGGGHDLDPGEGTGGEGPDDWSTN
jgi:hypothetical protein